MAAIPSGGSLVATHDYYRREYGLAPAPCGPARRGAAQADPAPPAGRLGSASGNSACGGRRLRAGKAAPQRPGEGRPPTAAAGPLVGPALLREVRARLHGHRAAVAGATMNLQVTGLGLDKMKLDSPQSFLDQEEAEEAEEQQLLAPAAWRTYMERRAALREFLTAELSPQLLKRHHARMELLRKCSYYIEILPKHLALGDQNPLVLPSTMFQLIDPWKFQRMKKVGTAQTKIQLLLLGDLLEQLDRGRAELDALLESPDPRPFVAGWGLVEQRLADLSAVVDSFLALMVPGRLHIKHRLVSDVGATKIPHIRLMLSTKMPVVFDRKESVAHQDWVSLRWFVTIQPAAPEQFELRFKLLDPRTQQECTQCGIIPVAACTFDIHNLLPNRSYKFTVKRAESYTLVYEPWRDSLTLHTRPGPPEGRAPSRLGKPGLPLPTLSER
uniref:Fibronectin type III domain containing 11 n=1 Tax=Canis lupus familiaris TaxID=9615 RepID=A0A8C0N2H2_CANLF